MVESVDTKDLKSFGYCSCAGSSPASSTVDFAEVAQLVEHNLAKVRVAGSSPVFRSKQNASVICKKTEAFCFDIFAFADVTAGNLVRKVSGKFLIQIRAVRQKCVQIAGFVRPRKQSIPLFLKSSRFLRGFLPESVGASLLFANNPGGFPDCFLSSR